MYYVVLDKKTMKTKVLAKGMYLLAKELGCDLVILEGPFAMQSNAEAYLQEFEEAAKTIAKVMADELIAALEEYDKAPAEFYPEETLRAQETCQTIPG